MKSTVLLTFIHGFSGDDDTFRNFPTHLKDAVQKALPDWQVTSLVYPKYETKGDLPSCVTRFREWLQTRVEELEPSSDEARVRTVLVAHSMGGFVAADTVLSIVNDYTSAESEAARRLPRVHGLLAVDTPFMGIASPMLAYSAFSQFSRVSNAYRLMSMLPASFLGKGKDGQAAPGGPSRRTALELGAIPAWRTIAAYAGTTGALAAAGVAAYMNREELFQGYTWLQNHLQFVGVITKRGESRLKLARITALEGFGFANLFTSLGQNTAIAGGSYVPERTFCALPPAQNPLSTCFHKEVNLVAKDEIDAHTSMFKEDVNPGYHRLLDDAQSLVVDWVQRDFHGYRTTNLDQKTTEAMDGSTEEPVPGLSEDAEIAANVPLPNDDDDLRLPGDETSNQTPENVSTESEQQAPSNPGPSSTTASSKK